MEVPVRTPDTPITTLRAECQGRLSDIPALSATVEAFCKELPRQEYVIRGRTAHDQPWIDELLDRDPDYLAGRFWGDLD